MTTDKEKLQEMTNRYRFVLMLLIGALLIMFLFIHKGASIERDARRAYSKLAEYEQTIKELDKSIAKKEIERNTALNEAKNSKHRQDSIAKKSKSDLASYEKKSRSEKDAMAKRFYDKIVQLGEIYQVDSNFIDTLNQYVIDCEGKKSELDECNIQNTRKDIVIQADSSIQVDLKSKVDVLTSRASEYKNDAEYEKRGRKFWQGLSIGLGAFQAIIIYVAVTR
jgi:hypothetical protein